MSANLYFGVLGSLDTVDFPYQTPTELSRRVMRLTTKTDRLNALKEDVDKRNLDCDTRVDILNKIHTLMNSPNLELAIS